MDECLELPDDQGQVDVVEVSPVEAGASRLLGEVEDDGVGHVGIETRGGVDALEERMSDNGLGVDEYELEDVDGRAWLGGLGRHRCEGLTSCLYTFSSGRWFCKT